MGQTETKAFQAAESGDLLTLRELLRKYPNLVHARKNGGRRPIHEASFRNRWECVRCLHKNGSDLMSVTAEGYTPLHYAAAGGAIDVCKYIFEELPEADVNRSDQSEFTPLHWAADAGSMQTLQYLVHKGADINAKAANGWTPLHFACYGNEQGIVEFLVNNGADINKMENGCRSPLDLAVGGGHHDLVKQLIHLGADIDLCTFSGTRERVDAILNPPPETKPETPKKRTRAQSLAERQEELKRRLSFQHKQTADEKPPGLGEVQG